MSEFETNEIKAIREEMASQSELLQNILTKTNRLCTVLAGDEFNKVGLIEDVTKLKEDVQSLKNNRWIERGIIAAAFTLIMVAKEYLTFKTK
jgi:hypothetical protein